MPEHGRRSTTDGWPRVIVPVLSRMTAVMRWACSSAAPSRTRIPASAPLAVPTMIAVGVASPMAHGQAMIRTATAAVNAAGSARLGAEQQPERRTRPPPSARPPGRTGR